MHQFCLTIELRRLTEGNEMGLSFLVYLLEIADYLRQFEFQLYIAELESSLIDRRDGPRGGDIRWGLLLAIGGRRRFRNEEGCHGRML